MDESVKFSVWFLSIMLILLLFSCKVTYKVRNQQQSLAELLAMPCGTINSELEGKGNSTFTFRQKIMIDSPIVLFTDSIKIFYNNQAVPYTKNNSGKQDNGILKLSNGKFQMEWLFILREGVFDGDTIKIVQRSFILCADEKMSQDTMIYTFRNPVRIHGVNAP